MVGVGLGRVHVERAVVARVPDAVAIAVRLRWVCNESAVVAGVVDAVAVGVRSLCVLVDLPIAVVVNAVADFRCARVNRCARIVTISVALAVPVPVVVVNSIEEQTSTHIEKISRVEEGVCDSAPDDRKTTGPQDRVQLPSDGSPFRGYSVPAIADRVIPSAGIPSAFPAVFRVSTPDQHFVSSPGAGRADTGGRSVGQGRRTPSVGCRVVHATRVGQRVGWQLPPPNDHFATG